MKSTVTGGWRYAVKLYDTKACIDISEAMVLSGEAEWEPNCGPESDLNWKEMKELVFNQLPAGKEKSSVVILTKDDISSDDDSDVDCPRATNLPYYPEGMLSEYGSKECFPLIDRQCHNVMAFFRGI